MQTSGIARTIADRMIRGKVRRLLRGVYWIPPGDLPAKPCILVPNHHGWLDGFVAYHLVEALGLDAMVWVEDFGSMPLIGAAGALPFPRGDAHARAGTIRKTLRGMHQGQSLVLFGEGELHRPPVVLPMGRSLEFIASKVAQATVIPVAIRYEMSLHERPECFVMLGKPVEPGKQLGARTRLMVSHLLDELTAAIRLKPERFEVLAQGTLDMSERKEPRPSLPT